MGEEENSNESVYKTTQPQKTFQNDKLKATLRFKIYVRSRSF